MEGRLLAEEKNIMKVKGDSKEKVVLECSWKILGIFLECS